MLLVPQTALQLLGAIGTLWSRRTRQIGSTPNSSLYASMNATIT
jgi:hypothetical protein